jgi:hypothetical protein
MTRGKCQTVGHRCNPLYIDANEDQGERQDIIDFSDAAGEWGSVVPIPEREAKRMIELAEQRQIADLESRESFANERRGHEVRDGEMADRWFERRLILPRSAVGDRICTSARLSGIG